MDVKKGFENIEEIMLKQWAELSEENKIEEYSSSMEYEGHERGERK